MKIIFETLRTSNENIYVDFGDGVWKSYPVNDARANGINIPATCRDYSKIRIKGKAEVLPNLDVITGIKRYEKVGQDFEYIYVDEITVDNNNNTYHLDLGYMGQGISDLYFDSGASDLSSYIDCEHIPYNEVITANDENYLVDDGYGYVLLKSGEAEMFSFIQDNPSFSIEDDGSGNEVIYIDGSECSVVEKIGNTILVNSGSSLVWLNNPVPFTDNGSGYKLDMESEYFRLGSGIDVRFFDFFKDKVNITSLGSNTHIEYKGDLFSHDCYEITDSESGYDTTNFKNQAAEYLSNQTIYYKLKEGNSEKYIPTNIKLTLNPDVTININED